MLISHFFFFKFVKSTLLFLFFLYLEHPAIFCCSIVNVELLVNRSIRGFFEDFVDYYFGKYHVFLIENRPMGIMWNIQIHQWVFPNEIKHRVWQFSGIVNTRSYNIGMNENILYEWLKSNLKFHELHFPFYER